MPRYPGQNNVDETDRPFRYLYHTGGAGCHSPSNASRCPDKYYGVIGRRYLPEVGIGGIMVKVGTLKDFNNARKLLEAAGYQVDSTKSPSDLIRKLIVMVNTIKVEAVVIARIGPNSWVFKYDNQLFAEKHPEVVAKE
jgi:hypothetical protein